MMSRLVVVFILGASSAVTTSPTCDALRSVFQSTQADGKSCCTGTLALGNITCTDEVDPAANFSTFPDHAIPYSKVAKPVYDNSFFETFDVELPEFGDMSDELTFVSWDGEYGAAQQRVVQAYRERYNITVHTPHIDVNQFIIFDLFPPALVDPSDVGWDVVDLPNFIATDFKFRFSPVAFKSQEVYLRSPTGIPSLDDFAPESVSGYDMKANAEWFAPSVIWPYAFGYNTIHLPISNGKFLKTPAKNIDFFDTVNFPGKRGIENGNHKTLLKWAILADNPDLSVAAQSKILMGLDEFGNSNMTLFKKAYQKLLDLAADPNGGLVLWPAAGMAPALLEDDSFAFVTAYSGRITAEIPKGKTYKMIWDNQDVYVEGLVLPHATLSNTRKHNRALHFVAFMTQSNRIAHICNNINYDSARNSGYLYTDSVIKDYPNVRNGYKSLTYGVAGNVQSENALLNPIADVLNILDRMNSGKFLFTEINQTHIGNTLSYLENL